MSEPIGSGQTVARDGGRWRLVSVGEFQLLLVALIWGVEFVAQRRGVLDSSPFFFNAASFAVGAFALGARRLMVRAVPFRAGSGPGMLAGCALFAAMSLQSLGIGEAGAGKAAFITSLYVVLVPLGGLLLGQRLRAEVWGGVLLSLGGLWFLCVGRNMTLRPGDLLVLGCALFWATHILVVGRFASDVDRDAFSFWQFATCTVLSLAACLLLESPTFAQARAAALPVAYTGILSAGVAFSLQIAGQRRTAPSRAALLLSLETVVAAAGGWMLLGERFGARELLGSGLMLGGVVLSKLGGEGAASAAGQGGSE